MTIEGESLSLKRDPADVMNFVGIALRNLQYRPIRTCLSILSTGLAVATALVLVTLSHSIQNSTLEGMNEMGDDLIVMQKGAFDLLGSVLSEQTVERIAAIPGVARVSGELFLLAASQNRNVLTLGWPERSYLWDEIPMREGRVPLPNERLVAVLGQGAAHGLGKKLGDTLQVISKTLRIIGITDHTTLVNRELLIMPLADLQEASYRPRQVTLIHVNFERTIRGQEIASVQARIEAVGGVVALAPDEVLNHDRRFAIINAVSLMVSIIAVAAGALSMLYALMMPLQERRREIGVLAAIGWSRWRIVSAIVTEGFLICAIGCAFGVLLSYFGTLAFPHIPTIGRLVSFSPSIWLIGSVVAAAVVLCLLGSLVPAWRAARIRSF
jgi:putative ABC transport system permease protein